MAVGEDLLVDGSELGLQGAHARLAIESQSSTVTAALTIVTVFQVDNLLWRAN